MTIQEVERQSGMTRANIRFYEEKGLLTPQRQPNGYRDYSAADVETLRRVRLLRSLDISIDTIRALQLGERTLEAVLAERERRWNDAKGRAGDAEALCQRMRQDGAQYATLDAEKYLRPQPEAQRLYHPAGQADQRPYAFTPWRRLLAFNLDYELCLLLLCAVLSLGFHVNITKGSGLLSLLYAYLALMLQALIEPWLLHRFGATPGKAIMGIYIETESGERPTCAQARARTWKRFWYGLGASIPIFGLVRMWQKGYRPCRDCESCAWDSENELVCLIHDRKAWRGWIIAAAYAGCVAVNVLLSSAAALPPCRGRLTVAQFARNYNMLADYYGDETNWRLDETGAWEDITPAGVFIVRVGDEIGRPDWQFTLDADGYIQRAELAADYRNCDGMVWISTLEDQTLLGTLSIACAQPGVHAWSFAPQRIARAFKQQSDTGSVRMTYQGVSIAYDCVYQGFAPAGTALIPVETENEARMHLSIEIGDESH